VGAARFDCGPLFVQAHLALTDELKRVVAAYVKEILAAPLGPSPRIRELPPVHQPGTMEAKCDQFLIRYTVRYDDTDGSVMVKFIKLIDRTQLYRR
jgi:hypothetical protein